MATLQGTVAEETAEPKIVQGRVQDTVARKINGNSYRYSTGNWEQYSVHQCHISHNTVNSTSNSTGSVPETVHNQKQYGKQYRNSKENSTGRNKKENSSRNSTVKSKEVRIDLVY